MTGADVIAAAIILLAGLGTVGAPAWILWIVGAAAVAVAIHTLYSKVVKPIQRVGKRIHQTYEKVMEYDDRISDVERNTKQLTTNAGSHLADAVYRIEAGQVADRVVMAEHIEWSQSEFIDVWKSLAARDVIDAADEAGKKIEGGVS